MKIQDKTITVLRELINEKTEYRSGPQLITFFNDLGFSDTYGQGFPSRWMFTEERLDEINGTTVMEDCIKKLMSPINYIGRDDEFSEFVLCLDNHLAFDGYKLEIKNREVIILPIAENDEASPETGTPGNIA